jgi:ABC-type branched-subunit amino acid transport system substrate-binding protein
MNTKSINYFTLVLTVLLFACKTNQIASQTDTIKFDEYTPTETTILVPQETDPLIRDVAILDYTALDSAFAEQENKKSIYKVAVVFPFMEDSMRSAWSHAKDKNFKEFKSSPETDLSISFMEGMIIALKKMKLDAKFELTYYDDNNDENRIDGIIEKIKADSVDVIIGPSNKQNLVKLSTFAKSNKIVLLSPFSPSKSAAAENSMYYMFEPSLEQHFLSMINYGIDSIEDPHFKFIYHTNAVSQFYAEFVSNYIDGINDSLKDNDKIKYTLIETPNSSIKLDNYIDFGANNILIVNSFNETFIHTFLKQINSTNKTNKIIAFGMPGWEDSQIVRLEYVSSSNIHFTKSSWIDWKSPLVEGFSSEYDLKYGSKPKEAAFLGYDFTNFIFKTINDYGLNFNKAILGKPYIGLYRDFLFEKAMNPESKVIRVENTNLRIYKIEDFEPILVK